MNRKTLQKVIDAINNNKLEYAMGILDTLMESLPDVSDFVGTPDQRITETLKVAMKTHYVPQESDDEARRLEAEAKAKMAHIDTGAIQTG